MKKWIMAVMMMALPVSAWAIDSVAKVINQNNMPIAITSYEAEYDKGNQYQLAGIKHSIKYKNIGKQKIEAIEFGFVSFDVWNEFLDKMNGFSSDANDPGDSEKGTWITRPYYDFAFLSGFAYVSKIRFASGTIWKADYDEIQKELKKIQSDFDVKKLESKPEKK